ncbi:hypothetical protein [Spelaeicoccus albus]|uniref:Na+/melibiose symporter-like transporter n=1 Tax=Spelaeicoccus albus TaxID=1280376 RepID=A0A7Z0D1R2_9MICO|nr:hypothetical protein [Spelaeicoccus albus]NYI66625.1 Na+/melibiose symporter-like transporter [Spelaeicoccus albus]
MAASWDKWKPISRRDKMGMLTIGIVLIAWDILAVILIPYNILPGSNSAVGIFFGLAAPAVFGFMALYFAFRSPLEKPKGRKPEGPRAKNKPAER